MFKTMQSRIILGITIVFAVSLLSVSVVNAQFSSQIPPWIKTAVTFWANDQITDQEFIDVIQYFVENEIITVPQNYNVVVNLQSLQSELNEKIRDSRVLANNIQVQNYLVVREGYLFLLKNLLVEGSLLRGLLAQWIQQRSITG